jgi:HSP20 family protein
MDPDKVRKWMDIAKQFQQGQFWDSVFDSDYTKQLMEQITETTSDPNGAKTAKATFPPVDIFKNSHEWLIAIDLPGVRREDVEISMSDYSLQIKGSVRREIAGMAAIQTERFHGEFERTITLPETAASGSKISAKFEHGALEIRIPRIHRKKEKIIIE